jgi:hypothetical protein
LRKEIPVRISYGGAKKNFEGIAAVIHAHMDRAHEHVNVRKQQLTTTTMDHNNKWLRAAIHMGAL